MSLTQDDRDLRFNTDAKLGPSPLLLRSMQLSEQLGRPFRAELEFVSENFNIDFSKIVGQNVTVTYMGGAAPRFFNGYISRFSQTTPKSRLATYTATMVPFLWFLTRHSDCRIFQNQTVPDIIKQVLQDRGFTDVIFKLQSGNYGPWEYCVQYRETDFNFISRLMEQEGIYYYFKHEKSKHSIVLVDDPTDHSPYPEYETIAYRPVDGDSGREYIRDWNVEQEVRPGTFASNDFDFKAPKKALLAASKVSRAHAHSNFEIYDYPGEYVDPDDGSDYAKMRIQELQSQFQQARGSSDAAGICVGCTFTLSQFPRADQNAQYLITSASYHISSDAADGSGSGASGPAFNSHFVAIDATTPFRTPRITPKPIVQGPQTAIVWGHAGQEIEPDQYGRVLVWFHWDRVGPAEGKNSSCWIRVSQLWAGKNWGAMYIPRIGQEVIVEFLEGDPDQPIITGRVYNGENTVPYPLPANKTMSTIKSNSSMGGGGFNEFRFEDKAGAEQIYTHAQKNMDTVVLNNQTLNVGNDRTNVIGHDETITVKHDRTETIVNNETVTVQNNRTETVVANETLTVNANRSRTVNQNESVTVALTRTHTVGVNEAISIGAAQRVSVGAVQTISVGAAQSTTVGAAQTNTIGASQTNTIGADQSNTIGAGQTNTIGADQTSSIGGNQGDTVGGDRSAAVTGGDTLTVGKALAITATDEITITVGDAVLVMKKDGTISINGKDITVEGSGAISMTASKNMTMKGQKILQN
jgi:type VI secretion system secreted protein VgrG